MHKLSLDVFVFVPKELMFFLIGFLSLSLSMWCVFILWSMLTFCTVSICLKSRRCFSVNSYLFLISLLFINIKALVFHFKYLPASHGPLTPTRTTHLAILVYCNAVSSVTKFYRLARGICRLWQI